MRSVKFVIFAMAAVFLLSCSSGTSTNGGGGGNGGGDGGDGNGGGGGGTAAAIIANHSIVAAFDLIPASYISQAIANFRIYYGHTSHGSQIITGLQMLQSSTYDYAGMSIEENDGLDLGHNGDTTWADTTRTRLNQAGSNINLVMWSWCAGVQDNTEEGINTYLNTMNALEQEYPSVKFVYMTGHLFNSSEAGSRDNLLERNEQIRTYCRNNNKILFDFEDIESYDPDGVLHHGAGDTDACGWCTTWCGSHTCGGLYAISCTNEVECAHSHCFNCYLKGKAFWWLVARMSGWSGS